MLSPLPEPSAAPLRRLALAACRAVKPPGCCKRLAPLKHGGLAHPFALCGAVLAPAARWWRALRVHTVAGSVATGRGKGVEFSAAVEHGQPAQGRKRGAGSWSQAVKRYCPSLGSPFGDRMPLCAALRMVRCGCYRRHALIWPRAAPTASQVRGVPAGHGGH